MKIKRNKSNISSMAYEIYAIDEIKSSLRIAIFCAVLAAIFVPMCWQDENYYLFVSMIGSGSFCAILSIYFLIRLFTNNNYQIVFRISQEGMLVANENRKATIISWDMIDSVFFGKGEVQGEKKEYRLQIILKSGHNISFDYDKYFAAINIYRLRRALRYFSKNKDFGKSRIPLLFLW